MTKQIKKTLIVKGEMHTIKINPYDYKFCSASCDYIEKYYHRDDSICFLFETSINGFVRCEKCIMCEKLKILSNI